ncbi:hemolysin activator protein, HlyB family [Propionigenium maris DSM 9537]|uniref:Hemolysin activator protein, HlyB family n=1 Tax=Propionigenium maris DSM 9537 TaxID=1123000 RepID=A0A9W6GJ02_9FUSO|nr:ShlB/FhaC/HecB family hemolysin secretion/activation protein [Propionigenium maris]GLI54982.1 hemolysin activator protein, HlyB family [Propionigenium maris DSM 9537]
MKKKVVYLFLLLILSHISLGREIRNPAERIQEQEMRRRIEKEVGNQLRREVEKIEEVEEEEDYDINSGKKFYVSKITLINSELLSTKEKKEIISKYVNKEMGMVEIHQLIKDITNAYIKKGYIAARVTIPVDQNLKSEELSLQIFEGKLEKVEINDGRIKDKIKEKFNLQIKEGEVIDLKKIELSENIINSVPKSTGSYKLLPGSEIGQTILKGDFKRKRIGNIDLNYDNLGSEGTGEDNVKLSYTHGDILGFSDNLYIQGSTTTEDDTERYSRNAFLDYKIPMGFWETGFNYSYSQSKNTMEGEVNEILQESETQSIKLKLNKTIFNGSRGRVRLESNFTLKDSDNYIEKSWVESSSYRSSQYDLGVSYTGILLNGSVYGKLSYTRGLGSLGAHKDKEGSEAKRQFDRIKFYGRYYKPLGWLNNSLAYESTLDSQYSLDNLYSSDKFYIGDDTTVRGFKNGVSGENGMFIRQQLYYTLRFKEPRHVLKGLHGLQFFLGADYGFADNSINKGSSKYLSREELFSASVGLKRNFNFGSLSVTYSLPIKAPDYVEKDESGIFYILAGIYI